MAHALQLISTTIILTLLVLAILTIGGRRSIAELSLIHFVVVIAVGEALLLPITTPKVEIWETALIVLALVLLMILIEWLELKFNFVERFITKKAVVIVKDGELQVDVLKKNRLTVDALESQLRMEGVSNFEELKTVTLEHTGKIGYEYKYPYQNCTVLDLYRALGREDELEKSTIKGNNQFDEITDGHSITPDKKLE